jgi:organic radical activating enzyme
MKSIKTGHELDKLAQIWLDRNNKFYIWGAAIAGKKFISRFKEELCIKKIIDSDPEKTGKFVENRIIVKFDPRFLESGDKIIVCTNFYHEVRQELLESGFRENIDFIERKKFLGIRYYYKEKQIFIHRVDVSVTNKCTLCCEKCNMLMPYFQEPKHKSIESIKQDLDIFFRWVDVVEVFDILGGEPLLYPDLIELLMYIKENFMSKIDSIHIFTNGTCILTKELLRISKELSVVYDLSDYTEGIPALKEKVDKFESDLLNNGITVFRDRLKNWLDFGYPEVNYDNYSEDERIVHFHRCGATFRGLYDKKFYYCHLEASAVQAGLFEQLEGDYVELDQLSEENKVKIVEFDQGYSIRGYPSFCLRCDGCGSKRKIPVAKQYKKNDRRREICCRHI